MLSLSLQIIFLIRIILWDENAKISGRLKSGILGEPELSARERPSGSGSALYGSVALRSLSSIPAGFVVCGPVHCW